MAYVKRIARYALILAFWLGVWAGLAHLVGRELLLPGPLTVLKRLLALMATADFWRSVGASLGRILCGAVSGIALGALLAALTSRFRPLRALLSPLLTIIKSTPVASFILLLLIWLGRDIVPAAVVLVMVLPVVWANVSAGVESADPRLIELARVYRFSPVRLLRRVYIPSVRPYFLSACRTALGLAWKAGVAAEVLTVPRRAIGRMLYESKLYLETVDLFAWTVVVLALSLMIEKLLAAALTHVGHGRTGSNRT